MIDMSLRAGGLLLLATAAAVASAAAAGATVEKPRYFELRIYTPGAGKTDALHKRFREHTMQLFTKHGIQNIGYWMAVDEKHQGRLYFLLGYPDKESRDRMWVEGFAKDPAWLKVLEESQKDGKLVETVEQVFLVPTDYSPTR
jgi:hypothetical protein